MSKIIAFNNVSKKYEGAFTAWFNNVTKQWETNEPDILKLRYNNASKQFECEDGSITCYYSNVENGFVIAGGGGTTDIKIININGCKLIPNVDITGRLSESLILAAGISGELKDVYILYNTKDSLKAGNSIDGVLFDVFISTTTEDSVSVENGIDGMLLDVYIHTDINDSISAGNEVNGVLADVYILSNVAEDNIVGSVEIKGELT